MNVFSYLLAKGDIPNAPQVATGKFTIDDNIGESIHIHYRNTRLEFSIDDFICFADNIKTAAERLEGYDGDC